ncbi:MAG: DNA-directed RNA polymerase subunit omega [bacterium]
MALVPLEEVLKRVPNVYEAVIIAAKEARLINERRLMEQARLSNEEEPTEEENRGEEQKHPSIGAEEEKVTVQALKKLIEGKIHSSYEPEKE